MPSHAVLLWQVRQVGTIWKEGVNFGNHTTAEKFFFYFFKSNNNNKRKSDFVDMDN